MLHTVGHKFKRKTGKETPKISTSSLPDIIFILLFFFMMVTVMRDSSVKVRTTLPQATEIQKLEKKSLVNYVYIGRPIEKFQKVQGTKPQIQLGDKFATELDIPLFLEKHKLTVPEGQRAGITTSLRVDRGVTMGIVADVKTALRKANQLKVNYSAKPEAKR